MHLFIPHAFSSLWATRESRGMKRMLHPASPSDELLFERSYNQMWESVSWNILKGFVAQLLRFPVAWELQKKVYQGELITRLKKTINKKIKKTVNSPAKFLGLSLRIYRREIPFQPNTLSGFQVQRQDGTSGYTSPSPLQSVFPSASNPALNGRSTIVPLNALNRHPYLLLSKAGQYRSGYIGAQYRPKGNAVDEE